MCLLVIKPHSWEAQYCLAQEESTGNPKTWVLGLTSLSRYVTLDDQLILLCQSTQL